MFAQFWYLPAQPTASRFMIEQMIFMLFVTLQAAAYSGSPVKKFTVRGRSIGLAISYNTSVMLFGRWRRPVSR